MEVIKMAAMRITPIAFEKMKCDELHNQIMDFKEIRGELPECLLLTTSRIPDECKATMSLTIDDTIIPIIELSEHPC
jgi:hypothetical protein